MEETSPSACSEAAEDRKRWGHALRSTDAMIGGSMFSGWDVGQGDYFPPDFRVLAPGRSLAFSPGAGPLGGGESSETSLSPAGYPALIATAPRVDPLDLLTLAYLPFFLGTPVTTATASGWDPWPTALLPWLGPKPPAPSEE